MTKDNLKNLILSSQFSKENLNALLGCVEILGPYSTSGLELKLSSGDALSIENYVTDLWVEFAKYYKAFLNSDSAVQNEFWNKLNNMKLVLNDDDKADFLWCVMDIKKIIGQKNAQQLNELVDFEILCFEYLPENELIDLIKNHLLSLCQKINLTLGVQYIFDRNFFDTKYKRMRQYSDALTKNSELVNGTKISEILNNFINFNNTPIQKRGTFDITDFISKNSNLFGKYNQIVSEILKFFVWVNKPVIEETQVREFIQERRQEKQKFANEQIQILQELVETKPDKYEVLTTDVLNSNFNKVLVNDFKVKSVDNFTFQKINTNKINIDKKLEELRDKVKS